jgi:hypothetical protein
MVTTSNHIANTNNYVCRRILLFPKGNGQHEMMSIYLEVVPEEGLEKDWSICGQFAIVISHPTNSKHFFSNRNVATIHHLI